MKKIQAINDHVVVEELIKTEDKTDAGIIIPQTVKMEPQKYGKILSIGEKVTNLKVDDIVVFHQSGGQAVIVNGVIQRILKNDEIYGVLRWELKLMFITKNENVLKTSLLQQLLSEFSSCYW